MVELCRRYGITRPTAYKWVNRYEEEGIEGLKCRSHAAKVHPNQVKQDVVKALLRARKKHPTWGPKKLVEVLKRSIGEDQVCSASTAGEILRQHQLTKEQLKRNRTAPWENPLGHYDYPNAVWCVDFKGWKRLGDGQRCDPLTLTDGYSRYLLRCEALKRQGHDETMQVMKSAFREYGLPERIRSDNGRPFACVSVCGLTALSVWFIKLGIVPERIAPGKPYQNGRHERFHLTLEEVMDPMSPNVGAQQRRFNSFRRCFNEVRPHEALGQRTPASVYEKSVRQYHGEPKAPEYEPWVIKRRIQKRGEFNWKGETIFLTEALRGETVGIEEIEEGILEIRYFNMSIARYDERTKKMQGRKKLDETLPESRG
jgi:transposase InsO family protein